MNTLFEKYLLNLNKEKSLKCLNKITKINYNLQEAFLSDIEFIYKQVISCPKIELYCHALEHENIFLCHEGEVSQKSMESIFFYWSKIYIKNKSVFVESFEKNLYSIINNILEENFMKYSVYFSEPLIEQKQLII
ncbi:MAG: hypothetical protein PHN56_01220 [Candidatus Nanoarchaeia archaeon]|nr:hypothetical protein [Candidatus Nanoarchaeia archaeon]